MVVLNAEDGLVSNIFTGHKSTPTRTALEGDVVVSGALDTKVMMVSSRVTPK